MLGLRSTHLISGNVELKAVLSNVIFKDAMC